jgi:hypothetical protein
LSRWIRTLASTIVGKKLFHWLGGQVKEGTRRRAKWPFIVIPLLYWIFPDVLPFLPWDDLLVTLISWIWYRWTGRSNSIHQPSQHHPRGTQPSRQDAIDIEATVIEDEEDSPPKRRY